MRVLFTTRPFLGHLYPMMPLAQALEQDGHEVVIASTGQFLPEVTPLGMRAIPAGLDPRRPPDAGESRAPGYGESVIRSKVDDIVAWAAHSPVDLVVREPTDFAGIFAAEILDVPHLTLGRSQFLSPAHWGPFVGHNLERVRSALGLAPDPDLDSLFGSCYLDTVPSWFQPAGLRLPRHRVEIRPEPYDGPGLGEAIAPQDVTHPGVYVTFGTVYNRDAEVVRTVVSAVSDLGHDVLCTVGPGRDPQAMVPHPRDGVTVRGYVPQSTVLPHCSLVVCHGGYSTVMGALCAGVPLVLTPRGSDHFANAQRCEQLGVGIAIQPDDLTEEAVRAAASAVLTEPRFANAAQALARRIDAGPPARFGARLVARIPTLHRMGVDCTGSPLVPERPGLPSRGYQPAT